MTAAAAFAPKTWQDAHREELAPLGRMPEPDLAVHPAFDAFICAPKPAAKSTWVARLLGRKSAQIYLDPAQSLSAAVEDRFAEIIAAIPADPELLLPKLDQAFDALVEEARKGFGRETSETDAIYQVLASNLKVEARREIYFAARQRVYERQEPNEAARALLPILAERGVVGIDIGKRLSEQLRAHMEAYIGQLNDAPAPDQEGSDPRRRKKSLNLFEELGFVRDVDDLLRETGVTSAMNYYLGHNVGLAYAQLHLSKPDEDKWFRRMYEDVGCNPKTRDLHFDGFTGITKCILYLDDIDEGRGPFSFVPGSHRWESALLPRLAAKANSAANDFTTPLKREAFVKLPPTLRHDTQLGYHVVDEHPLSKRLLGEEEMQTTDRAGHLVLFDPLGLHRGGQCRTGNRICVVLVFTPVTEIGKPIYPF